VRRFNEYINSRDLDGVGSLLTDDHVFIDSTGNTIRGKKKVLEAWRSFFESFSDYRNVFESLEARGGLVVVTGRSVCSDERLNGPALWTARVKDGKVAEWRVYEDTAENRHRLGIA